MKRRMANRRLPKEWRVVPISGALALVCLVSTPGAQQNQCVSCHVSSRAPTGVATATVAPQHTADWDWSAHGAADVGCDACHGGDPEAPDLVGAHERVLRSTNPASPVHFRQIPSTCGTCHPDQHQAFETSRHSELVRNGVTRAPTCLTCHGAVAANFPDTRGIGSVCASCHGPTGSAPMSEYQTQVRLMRELISDDRYQLALVRTVIAHTRSGARREELEAAYREAEAPLAEATAAWHSFTFDTAVEPLALAGRRITALLERLTPQ